MNQKQTLQELIEAHPGMINEVPVKLYQATIQITLSFTMCAFAQSEDEARRLLAANYLEDADTQIKEGDLLKKGRLEIGNLATTPTLEDVDPAWHELYPWGSEEYEAYITPKEFFTEGRFANSLYREDGSRNPVVYDADGLATILPSRGQ